MNLSTVDPTIRIEMRYAGSHNFVGHPIAGYEAPTCILTRRAALALARVQAKARQRGLSLKVYDCYRPQRAVDSFVRWAADPRATKMKAEFYPRVDRSRLFADGYIAARSSHSRGSTVDLTLVPVPTPPNAPWSLGDPLVGCTAPVGVRFGDDSIDMGTGFDCFDPLAHPSSTQVPPRAQANRELLRGLMASEGFAGASTEWWHFTLIDEPYPDTSFDFPVTAAA